LAPSHGPVLVILSLNSTIGGSHEGDPGSPLAFPVPLGSVSDPGHNVILGGHVIFGFLSQGACRKVGAKGVFSFFCENEFPPIKKIDNTIIMHWENRRVCINIYFLSKIQTRPFNSLAGDA